MPFWSRKEKKGKSSVAEHEDEEMSSSDPVDTSEQGEESAMVEERDEQGRPKKSFLKKFESNIRRKVDGYVDNKAGELLDDATTRAQHFRQETLDEVRANAMELLDLTESRIDEKLVEIEDMLEKRLRAELKMRLRAMIWTLVFVLLMALVSFAYVLIKRTSGLDDAQTTEQSE